MASPATEILGPWPAANPTIRSLSHRQQAENVSWLKDVGVGVVAHRFVVFNEDMCLKWICSFPKKPQIYKKMECQEKSGKKAKKISR